EVVSRLEDSRRALESELAAAEAARTAARQAEDEAKQRLHRLEADRDRETENARAEARRIVERARAEAQQLLDELDDIRKRKNAADFAAEAGTAKSRLRSRLRAVEEAMDPVHERKAEGSYQLPRPLKAGDEVLLVELDKKAVVLSAPDSSGNVEVQAGIIRTRVPVTGLRLLEGGKNTAPSPASPTRKVGGRFGKAAGGVRSRAERDIHTELDLRGMTTDESLLELDRFIDDAVLSGLEHITIIHGKGTGALRAAVQTHLRSHPSIAGFRLGGYGEGENGVTIAELK
ncbi:MAG: endonuclease MutS2, partial [Clostridiales bacterium]|nr:endonuclease MutS2 [Clostridiales bacterium]